MCRTFMFFALTFGLLMPYGVSFAHNASDKCAEIHSSALESFGSAISLSMSQENKGKTKAALKTLNSIIGQIDQSMTSTCKADNETESNLLNLAISAYVMKARLLLSDGDISDAEATLDALHFRVLRWGARQDSSKVIEQPFIQALKGHSASFEAIELKGKTRFLNGDEKSALHYLENVDKLGQLSLDGISMLSKIYEKLGDCDRAIDYFGRSVGINQNSYSNRTKRSALVNRCYGNRSKVIEILQ